jgi:hypothetical protein
MSTARLLGINALATELNRDRRTIARALRTIPPDGKSHDRHNAWHLTTALRALEATEGRHRSEAPDESTIALEYATHAMLKWIERLRIEPDVARRRKMLEGEGHVIGEYVRALDRVRAPHSPEQRMIEQPFIDRMLGGAIGDVLALCHIELDKAGK